MKFYVYKHTFINGTVYYGKGSGNRINVNKRNRYWTALFKKYGEPVREYLHTDITEIEAFRLEEAYIKNSSAAGIAICNLSSGGEKSAVGHMHTTETKVRISQKLKGVSKSVSTKIKMSEALRKAYKTASCFLDIRNCNRKAVLQFTKDNILVMEYSSIQEAFQKTKINPGNISSVCNNKLKTAGGFYWKYK